MQKRNNLEKHKRYIRNGVLFYLLEKYKFKEEDIKDKKVLKTIKNVFQK